MPIQPRRRTGRRDLDNEVRRHNRGPRRTMPDNRILLNPVHKPGRRHTPVRLTTPHRHRHRTASSVNSPIPRLNAALRAHRRTGTHRPFPPFFFAPFPRTRFAFASIFASTAFDNRPAFTACAARPFASAARPRVFTGYDLFGPANSEPGSPLTPGADDAACFLLPAIPITQPFQPHATTPAPTPQPHPTTA